MSRMNSASHCLHAIGWKLIVVLGVFTSPVGAQEVTDPEAREVMNSMADEMDRFIDKMAEIPESTDTLQIEHEFTTNPNLTGPLAAAQMFAAEIMNFSVSETNAYGAELEQVGLLTVLDPVRLQTDDDYSESRTMLAGARQVIDKYRNRQHIIEDKVYSMFDELDMPAEMKDDFEAGVKQGLASGAINRTLLWDLEEQSLDQFDGIIDTLSSNAWEYDGEYILFESDDAAAKFNDHLATIDAIFQEQIALQRSVVEDNMRRQKRGTRERPVQPNDN